MNEKKGIPEGIRNHWLPILTGYAYLLTYMYYAGYLSALRLPDELIEVSLTRVLSVAASLFVFSMPLFFFIDEVINYFRPNPVIQEIETLELSEDEERFRPYLRSVGLAVIQYSLAVAYLMFILWLYEFQWQAIVFQASILAFLVVVDTITALTSKKRDGPMGIKWYLLFEGPFAPLTRPHQPLGMLKQWIGGYDRFVILALLGLYVIWQWGNSKVYRLNRVWTTDINGGLALVSRYGENLVCVPMINNELVLDGKFSLIKITDSKPVDFKQAVIKRPTYQLLYKAPAAKIENSSHVSPNAETPPTIHSQDDVVPNKPGCGKAEDKPIGPLNKVQESDNDTSAGPVRADGDNLPP